MPGALAAANSLVPPDAAGRILVLSDGRKYDGALKDGLPEGQGTLTDPAGSVTGAWKAGCFNDGKNKVAFGVSPSACP